MLALVVVLPVIASALDNGLARTPPMGISTWGGYGCDVNEEAVLSIADDLVSLGLRDLGYNIIQIDDCWSNKTGRSPSGELVPNMTSFTRGIKFVADHVNKLGFKLGIYTDIGIKTCAGFPGSQGHSCQDAQTFADWGIQYVKQDYCYMDENACGTTGEKCYGEMSECLNKTGKPIIYGLCSWGSDSPWTYGPKIANLWRTSADQQDNWESIMRTIDNQRPAIGAVAPGGWSDLDELFLAGPLPLHEKITTLNFWAMFAAPFQIGDPMKALKASPDGIRLYTNREVIAIDQDVKGIPAKKFSDSNPGGLFWTEGWARPLANGDYAVMLFNRGSWGAAEIGFALKDVGDAFQDPRLTANAQAQIRDLWNHTDLGVFTGSFPQQSLNNHASLLLRVHLLAQDANDLMV